MSIGIIYIEYSVIKRISDYFGVITAEPIIKSKEMFSSDN